jgi:hypothetical protein
MTGEREKRMIEFLRRATEWMLEREAELARRCAIDLDDLEKQIAKVEEKRTSLERQCRENLDELERILTRLKWIRLEEMKCRKEQESEAEKGGE